MTIAQIVKTSQTIEFKKSWDEVSTKVYDILHLLPWNKDHVDFLTFITKQYSKDIDAFYKENIFICPRCNELSILGRMCSAHKTAACIPPKVELDFCPEEDNEL
jgi:hypothetical protein